MLPVGLGGFPCLNDPRYLAVSALSMASSCDGINGENKEQWRCILVRFE